ncbi:Uncharacterized protein DUF324 [Rhodovulum sp. PH10]|uniref:RAMP superfamily CRISPR-associated protein n=1 Tax=Rhodovulum sp. PH10 TaxID=1187851 RepID=UPI00027C241E|nr:RAMP superfamily CRISPR-associated protein [Rhodovulum sp. PH10]EJW09406.1 Uncharacterized protein DUF324 [Rhodovulum sp. PH10]
MTNAVAPAGRIRPDDGTFGRPATAIDRDTGAAADNKLFAQRAVAAGAGFDLHGRLLCTLGEGAAQRETVDAALDRLAVVLAPLAAGIEIGKGTRHGYGRLRLAAVTSVAVRCFGPDGYGPADGDAAKSNAARDLQQRIEARRPATSPRARPATRRRLVLDAPGPFLILDPAAPEASAAPAEDADGAEVHINVRGLAGADGTPVLWPSSLLGALRSRAAWLLEIDRLRRGDGCPFVPDRRKKGIRVDDRFLECVFDDRRSILGPGDLEYLTPVERLFGVPGWRGLVTVERLACVDRGQPRSRTSLAIDRLTGGGKHGALFTVEAVEGCRFEVDLAIGDAREARSAALETLDDDFFAHLEADLLKNGLMLGHGAARGYGWFTVAKASRG